MSDLPRLRHTFNRASGSTPILFLHGFMGDQDDWSEVADRMHGRYSTLTVDLPGHVRAQKPLPAEAYSMPGTAKLVIDLMDRLEITQCHLVGYSMGGRLGLYLLTNYADRFRSSIIESGSPGLKTEPERSDRRTHDTDLAEQLLSDGLAPFLEHWYQQPLFATIDRTDPKFAAMLKRKSELDPTGLALSLKHMGTGTQPSLWPQLERIIFPTLFLSGERDIKFSDLATEMAGLCRSGRTGIIAGAGHNVHYERPDAFTAEVIKFLNEHE